MLSIIDNWGFLVIQDNAINTDEQCEASGTEQKPTKQYEIFLTFIIFAISGRQQIHFLQICTLMGGKSEGEVRILVAFLYLLQMKPNPFVH